MRIVEIVQDLLELACIPDAKALSEEKLIKATSVYVITLKKYASTNKIDNLEIFKKNTCKPYWIFSNSSSAVFILFLIKVVQFLLYFSDKSIEQLL
nr:hypothetical protein [Clostridium sp. FP2]